MTLTTIALAAAAIVAVDLIAVAMLIRRHRRARGLQSPHLADPPRPSTPGTRTGARVISCRTIPSFAGDRGKALVELRLELDGASGAVARTTWEVDLDALALLQQDSVVWVEAWDGPTPLVEPAAPWARSWPPVGV